jgi:MFS family permease
LFVGWAVGAPLAGYFSDYTGRRLLPLMVGALGSLASISVILYMPGLSYLSLNLWMFAYGVFSGTEIIIFIMAKENSGANLSGTVFAVANMIVTLGGVIFQPLVGSLLDKFSNGQMRGVEHVYSTIDYQLALSLLPVSLLMVMIAGFFLKDSTAQTSHRNTAA